MGRERTYRSEGIVLRRSNFGEADRLLTLYTRDFGKIKAIAKGVRKPQSRKTGHVELFMRTRFLFGKGRTLDLITQVDMVEGYAALRENLVRTTYAAYVVELLDKFTVEEEPHVGKYELLAHALSWLCITEDLLLVARFYELRLLSLTGFQPQLFNCVGCQTAVQEQDQFFSADMGGILCPACAGKDRRARGVTAVAVKLLRYLQTRSWDIVQTLQLKRALHAELESIMHTYIIFLLERHLKSVDFLHRLRQEATLFENESMQNTKIG